jgi:hypothetical protein
VEVGLPVVSHTGGDPDRPVVLPSPAIRATVANPQRT